MKIVQPFDIFPTVEAQNSQVQIKPRKKMKTSPKEVIHRIESFPTDSPQFRLLRAMSSNQELLSQRKLAAVTRRHRTTLRVHGIREKCGKIGGQLYYVADQVNEYLEALESSGLLRPRKSTRGA